jgi:serine protease Do
MKKRIISFVLAVALLTGTALGVSYTLTGVSYPVMINGTAMTFTDAVPMNYNGRTMLPLRTIAEALGIPIEWTGSRVEITTVNTEALKDACVMLYTGSNGTYTGQGSGVLIDYDEILTAFHVVDGDTLLTAYYDDSGAGQNVTLADTAPGEDAAILTPADKTVKPVPIGDSDTVQVGDKVYIISSPKQTKNVVTSGKVTGTGLYNGIYVFTSTAITDNGSSGGACFNSKGELIGVLVGGSDTTKISYVVPINDIRESLAG